MMQALLFPIASKTKPSLINKPGTATRRSKESACLSVTDRHQKEIKRSLLETDGVWNVLMERRGRSSRSDIRRCRAPVATVVSSCPCRCRGWKQEGAASTEGGAAKWDGMEWNVKQSGAGQGRAEGRGGREAGIGIGIGFPRGRLHAFSAASFAPPNFFLPLARLSGVEVEPWRPRLAFGPSEPLSIVLAGLLSRHK